MTTSLGGVTLAEPNVPIRIDEVFVGEQRQSHDGTLLTDYTNIKLKFKLDWDVVSQAERNAIYTQAMVVTSQAFVPPHTATSYTVVVKRGTYTEDPTPSGSSYIWKISLELEESV